MKIRFSILFAALAMTTTMFLSCSPDDNSKGNGIVAPELDSSFTIAPVNGSANRFLLTATNNTGVLKHAWNIGQGVFYGGATQEIFLPDAGSYTISHGAVSYIGGTTFTSSQDLVVETPDPVAGNMIAGGRFENADDIAEWTVLPMSSDAHWTFANGAATLTSGPTGWAQEALYQAIQVEGGHAYKFDMKVKGPGWTDSVFELYADYQQPVAGTGDYSAGGKVLSLNTWGGCGTSAFDGQLFNLSCDSQYHGVKTFPTSGTVYVLVRGGGANGNFNITIDNVEVRRND